MSALKSTRTVFVIVMLACLLVGYYFYLSHGVKRKSPVDEEDIRATRVQEVLMKDLARNYPASPKEVLKFYGELSRCFYNEEYSDDELQGLAQKAMELYDDELISNQGGYELYLGQLKSDIQDFKNSNVTISSYSTSASTDVDYFSKDGRDCAGLYCDFTMREGTSLRHSKQLFILRKDGEGHWKILGWEMASPQVNQG